MDRTGGRGPAYVICTTPRSGSGLLCSALWSTGVAGYPDEYLAPRTRRVLGSPRYASRKARNQWILSRGSTPNGVFGMKVHWSHVEEARRSRAWIPWHRMDHDPIHEIAPQAHLIWLRREDRVRQAVSAYRAAASGRYILRQGDPARPATPVQFEFEPIHRWVARLSRWNGEWERYFAGELVAPLDLVYEQDLERDYRRGVRRVLEHTGIGIPDGVETTSPFLKQADAVSEELVQRYLEEASRRDSDLREADSST